ncbi:MAG: preprotein translocase subunit YajC [Candidatus Omnitrophica bacterium]|nr:preprotein translocase subunit YajC [Candidatus Omnitrophota bacterium]
MPTQTAAVNPILQLVPFIFIFAIFYFMIIMPQRKQQKEHRNLLANLKKNDEVVTASGIHGTIINVKDTTVILRVDDNVKIEVEKISIAALKNIPSTTQGK